MEIAITAPDLPPFIASMHRAPQIVRDELTTTIRRVTLQGEAFAKQEVSVASGHGRRSIASRVTAFAGGVTGIYGTAVPYLRIVHSGRGAIVARGKALRFRPKGSGTYIYRKRVGPAAANPFMTRSVVRLRPILPRENADLARRIIAKLGGA